MNRINLLESLKNISFIYIIALHHSLYNQSDVTSNITSLKKFTRNVLFWLGLKKYPLLFFADGMSCVYK